MHVCVYVYICTYIYIYIYVCVCIIYVSTNRANFKTLEQCHTEAYRCAQTTGQSRSIIQRAVSIIKQESALVQQKHRNIQVEKPGRTGGRKERRKGESYTYILYTNTCVCV